MSLKNNYCKILNEMIEKKKPTPTVMYTFYYSLRKFYD